MENTEGTRVGASLRRRLVEIAGVIGPGVFLMGYIIGTGSVTSLANAGASYGMAMVWALALSCLFTYVLIISVSRCTIGGGATILQLIRQQFGKAVAAFILLGLMVTVISSVIGITAIASDIFREWTKLIGLGENGVSPVISTAFFVTGLYVLFWHGRHKFFLKAMAVVAAVMGLSFIASMLMVVPSMSDIAAGMIPGAPADGVASLALAGLVGTTMASVCIVARSYLVAEQGWGMEELKRDNGDAIVSLSLTFLVSVAIMACAAGTLYVRGLGVDNAVDMVATLQPIAGDLAMSVFTFGILAAALSSLFASYLLGPWIACDYFDIPRKMNRRIVRMGVLIIGITGFTVPVFGGSPVVIMIASQAFSPVIMPLIVILILIMLNTKKVMDKHYRNPVILNVGLCVTLCFTLFMSYAGVVGLLDFLRNL